MDGQTSPTDSGDPTARFAHLLEQVVADDLAPERRAELAALMQAQPEFVRKYAEAVHLRECLRDYAANNEAGLPPEPATTDAGVSAAPLSRAPHISKPKEASRLKVGWFPLALATCLALAVGLSVGRLAPTVGTAAGRGENASIGQPSGPRPLVAIGDSTRDRLGTITALSPEASSDGLLRALQVGDQLRRGEVIQLTRGVMRVGFAAGPEVIVQGPAEFSVVDDLAMYVHRGRVRTTATGRFTLQTALMAAKSEGAELALVTTADQSVEVFAYSGHAEISSNPHSNVEPEVLRKLGGGQGVLVSRQGASTRLTAVDAGEPAGVVRDWLEINERLHPYERLVLADDPMAYWPLYRVRRNRRVLDLTQHGYDGQAIGNWPAELSDAASTQVRGAYFDGESYIEPDAKPPVDLESGFTIEGWAKVMGGPEYQAVFTSRWVFASNTPTQQCFGFTLYAGNDDRWQFWSGSGEYGALWQTLSGDEPLERHEWTHVAASFRPQAVQDGEWVEGVVELYVNGQKAAEGVHRLSLLDFEWPARIGAAEFVPKSLTSWLFQGELRDVALYDYPLSPERLKAHHAEGEKAT